MSFKDIEKSFFGRGEILSLLKRRVVSLKGGYRQNVALIGNQYLGKSSLLTHFVHYLADEDVTVIYLDLENKDFHYFYSKFIGSLLYEYSKNVHLPLYEDLNLLLTSVKQKIPHTVDVITKIKGDYLKGKFSNVYLGLLALVEVFTNETGQFCVLIIDEFQTIEEFAIEGAFVNLGKKIMTQKKCFYIVSSSFPGDAQKILSEKLSLLFGNFEILELDCFDHSTSARFIEQNLDHIKMGVQLNSFLTDFTGGHPLYLNLVCQELRNLSALHQQEEVYVPLLSQAIENTIFDRWGVLSRHFELMVNDLCAGKGNRVSSHILMEIANGHNKIEDLVGKIDIKKSQISSRMMRLGEIGIIVKNGTYHYFKDKLFKYWVKYIYQKRIKDVELSPDKQKKQFKEEFNASVTFFKNTLGKGFSDRVVDLLHCFDNEAFHLNGRKYKLPLFKEILPVQIGNDLHGKIDFLQAQTEDRTWVVILKKERFLEKDIIAALEEVKKMGLKQRRMLIVSLSKIDENARLKALQEKFWIWNEGELNVLLTLFDKPFILK